MSEFIFSMFFFVIRPGIYLLDIIYIDSAYPASESIIETEQRTNQMNNVLRVISDLQMSCNYGEKHKATLSQSGRFFSLVLLRTCMLIYSMVLI